jgi:endonuclease-3
MKERAWAIHQALIDCFGEPRFTPGEDPTEMLIGTILSANTTDVNSGRAFDRLMLLGDWETIRTAPLPVIIDAIRPAGMYNQKAPHIVATLERLQSERGGYALDDLATMPLDDALAFLTSLPGVGQKTASIVLLFCFNRGAFPVDTHIQRITQRLGLSSPKATPSAIQRLWEALLPPATYYPLHLNLIRLGREICTAREARCPICPLQAWCDYARAKPISP